MLFCLYIAILLFAVDINRASYVTHPNINFDPLEQLGISGSYSGISLYKDTQQLTQIENSTSSVLSFSNETLRLIASSNINGTIYDACLLPNLQTLFVAGNFTTINNQIVNNVAVFDLSSSTVKPMLKGLDGPVHSLYCDTDDQSVYVGGSFTAPIGASMIAYTDSLAKFGGSVALWKNDQWNGLPWKGFNGPVYSILKPNKTSVLFGGKFDTTTDGQQFHAPASHPISIPANGVLATNTAANSGTPASILCADASNSNPWILSDGAQGTWTANFITYSVNPSLVRIVNSQMANHQTKEFSIRSLTDSTIYKLTYLDPVTQLVNTCTTNCTLSNDPSVTYQDYRITNLSMTSGIAIDIKSWYGVSGGLASVKVFQSEIFSYAINANTNNICAPASSSNNSTNRSILPKVTTAGGSWSNSSDSYLSIAVKSSDLTSPASVTFYPNLAESGIYEVLVYTPACASSGCSDRTDVDIIINTSSNQKTNVTMSQKKPGSTAVFVGYFDLSSSFDPSVTLQLAHNATIAGGKTVNVVASAVQFVKTASVDTLSSILEYNTTQSDITMTSLPWGALKDNVPYKSVVKSMDLLDGNIYIGGNFTGTDKSNIKYTNIIQYDPTINQMKALENGGVNGIVESIACSDTEVFVGGTFTALSGTGPKVDYLTNVARYNTQQKTWNALNGGVDGPISALHWIKEKNTMLVSGAYSHLVKNGNQEFSNKTSGNGWWNTQNNQWTSSNVPYLSGVVYGALSVNNNDYFIGNIRSAQTLQSNGISFISQSNSLIPFSSFNPDNNETTISVSSGVLYHNGAINPNTQKNTTTTILGGQFRLSGNIQNVAIYDNGTWSGVQGADWQGKISTMAVNNHLLYVGGRFSGANSNNLAIFDLSNKSLALVPEVTTLDGSPASVNIIRHIPTQNTMVVGGNFSAVGALTCSSICSLYIPTLQWGTLGSGLIGEVIDVQLINSKLVASGNLTLNNSPLPIAEFDFDKKTWGPFGTADLPGPSGMISYDNATNHLYISGQSKETDTAYLRIWDGQRFLEPKHELGPGSVISNLAMFPVVPSESTSSAQNILLASGFINLGAMGNVSAAFFDGDNWIPYLVTSSSEGGSVPSMNSIFFLDQPFIAPLIKKYLPTPIVILVAIAISLAIVFMIVLGAMLIVHFKRKRDTKVNPESNPASYYAKPPRTPESLLATLKSTSADDNDNDKGGQGAEKDGHLEPENQQLYNLSKAISSEHLHEQTSMQHNALNGALAMTTARAAPAPPTTHSRSVPQQNQSYNGYDNTTNYNNMASGPVSNHTLDSGTAPGGADAAGFGATASYYGREITAPAPTAVSYAVRPESYVRPVSEMQRDSNANSFYNNEYTKTSNTEMSEIPARYSPYNPFRNSETGVAATAAVAAAGATTNNVDSKQSNNSRSIPTEHNISRFAPQSQNQDNSYNNAAPPTLSALASNSPIPGTVRWTNAPIEESSIAVVKPISLVGTSDASSLLDPIYGPGSTRNNATTTSDGVPTTATIPTPAIAVHKSDEDNKYTTKNNQQPQSHQGYLGPASSSSISSFNNDSSANASNNVRWTNYNTDAAVGIATVEPVSTRDSALGPHYYSTSPNPSLLNEMHASEGLSSDPDIVRWTTAPSTSTNMSTAVTPVDPSELYMEKQGSAGREHYQTSISPVAWSQDENAQYEVKGNDAIANPNFAPSDDKMINTNAFRLSDMGSLPPIDTNSSAFDDHTLNKGTLSPDSAVRWKTANVGSPVETAHTPILLEPSSATVTHRSTDDDDTDFAFQNYFNFKDTETNKPTVVDQPVSKNNGKKNKYTPVVNPIAIEKPSTTRTNDDTVPIITTTHVDDNTTEPAGRKSEAIDDIIASRDLDALSMLIDDENPMPSQLRQAAAKISQQQEQQENQQEQNGLSPVPTNTRSSPSATLGVGAMDGRAASKRMVEDYLNSRRKSSAVDGSKRSKYKSDFRSIMESAILNNTTSDVATEDKPHLYYAKFDFNAREHGELGFEKADPIIVVDSSDDIWWMGYKADKNDGSYIQGVFPSNYVEVAVKIL